MTRDDQDRLTRLMRIAEAIRDQQQARLARHVQACAETRRHLADLAAPLPEAAILPEPILQEAALRHARWAAPRRIQLNETLALQTAARITAEADARKAFGRAMALEQVIRRHRDRDRGQLS